MLDRRNVRLEPASAPGLCIYNSKFNSLTCLFFSMEKQEKLAWAQPSATRPNSFQPGEGFHSSDSEGRQSYRLCKCACRYTRWEGCRASIVRVLQKWEWGSDDGNTGRSNEFLKIVQRACAKHSVWTPALLLLPLISALSALPKVFNSYLESRSREVGIWH